MPTKNNKISSTLKLTREKRKSQVCKVFQVKIDKSHLNQTTKYHLSRLFLEAKWFYNYVLSQNNIFEQTYKISQVPVKVRYAYYIRSLNCLSSQMKQAIIDKVKSNIQSLSTHKKHGHKIGKLKFKSEIFSVPLKQYERTHKIINDKYIKIQGIKQHLKVSGLSQIPLNSDISNANLHNKNGDYYLQIITFQPKPENISYFIPSSIGIDFGISSQLTLSNGIKVQYEIQISNKIKKLQRILSKKKQHSKNWYKTKEKLNKEHQYLVNIKQDIKNKIISHLKDNFQIVCFQNESLKFWQSNFGSKIQSTSLGGIIASLKQRVHTPVEVDRFYPSTKTCSECGNTQIVELSERVYVCNKCNNILDRDYNSALNIEQEGLKQLNVPMVYREFKPVEIEPLLSYLNSISYVKASLINESGSFIDLS